ncbi:hypothetical protein EG327_011689 [Venturia inaequalis]|uniref:Aminoglycoside phosphotransferase domain-containing protein n=1 Tax=Venturia inaequalis TaxID=5025 RepID=A0A8H3UBE4_VENIN|nr:hypothetical protein EG327_011689 [Venturia inaequalis]
MNFLRKLRERTVATPISTEQPTAARESSAAKASKKTTKLQNLFRTRATVDQNVAINSGEFRSWFVASSATNNLTEEPVNKQKSVSGRVKFALRLRRTRRTQPASALSDNPSDVPAPGTTNTGGEASHSVPISLSNPVLGPEPAPSLSSGSDDYSAPKSSTFSVRSVAETSLTVLSLSQTDTGDKAAAAESIAAYKTDEEFAAGHAIDAAAHDVHGSRLGQKVVPVANSHAQSALKNSPVSQQPYVTLETAIARPSWSKFPRTDEDTAAAQKFSLKTPVHFLYDTAIGSPAENLLREFGYVCEIPHEAIIQLVHEKFPMKYTTVDVFEMKHGSFNCVYFINVDDKETILLRVPAVARKHLWRDEDAKMMINDFRTTKFIGQKVDFGVPQMLSYDVGFENAIQAPHILESYIPGKPLYQLQREWRAQGTYQEKNSRAMKQLGAAMAQLCQKDLQLDSIGMLEFDNDDCANPRVGPITYMENSLDFGDSMRLKRVGPERDIHERLYSLNTSQSFFSDSFHTFHSDAHATGLEKSYQRIIALGLQLVPKSRLYPHEEKERFGLRHPDLDLQNILFDSEGNLQGIIDWSGTLTAPNYLSSASQPKFLVKDFMAWNPLPPTVSDGFEDELLAKQRSQFASSFTDSLVGKIGAGYLKNSPWFAAFERGVNDFECMEGKPVGRKNFVDKLFAANLDVNKDCFLEYLAKTGDEWPLYSEYYEDSTGIHWPHGEIDIRDRLTQMISWVFECEESQVPRYYGIGRSGPLTADMECSTDMLETTKELALAMLEQMEQDKDDQIKAFGGVEMYRKFRNEFRHRVGRLEYLEHLDRSNGARAVGQSAAPGPVGYGGKATKNAEAAVQKLEPLVGYGGRSSEHAQNETKSRKPVIGFQGRKLIEPKHKGPTSEEEETYGSITSIDHEDISNLVMKLIDKASPDGVHVMNHTARGSHNFVYFIKVIGGPFDGLEMALRIPARGIEGHWTKSDRSELTSQACTMMYIKRNTTVPVPTVFFYDDTCENHIRAPFILMQFVSGKSLGDCMVRWDIQGILNKMMKKSLKSIAKAMVELGKLQFEQIGELQFPDRDDRNPSVSQDWILGPMDSSEQYFRVSLDKFGHGHESWPLEYQRICEAVLEAFPKSKISGGQQKETFGLVHRDSDAQNFLVDDDGNLTAILDWDWSIIGPNLIGPKAFPKFLQGDPAGQYNHMFSDAQMEKLRQMYNVFYHEENMAVNGDVYGGMANRTSLLICDLDRALRNAPDAMEQFIDNLFKDVLPDFDPAETLSILADPSSEWLDIKAQIIKRVRHFLSNDLG